MSDEKLRHLIDTYADTILRLSFSYLKNLQDAEDVCQTVFIKMYNSSKEFNDNAHEKAYILHITTNVCKDILKSSWKKRNVDFESIGDIQAPNTEENDVLNQVNKLDEKYRTVIYLHYYEGYKVAEIAEILKISVANVKIRLSRGKGKLKDILEEN